MGRARECRGIFNTTDTKCPSCYLRAPLCYKNPKVTMKKRPNFLRWLNRLLLMAAVAAVLAGLLLGQWAAVLRTAVLL